MALDPGRLTHLMTLESPTPTPDGDGGYTQTWARLDPPEAWASIEPATTRALERLVAGTVVVQPSHIVRLPYHPDLDEECRMTFVDRSLTTRTLNVVDVLDPDEEGVELIVLCVEPPI